MKSENLVAAIGYLGFTPQIDVQIWRIWIQKVAFILKALNFEMNFEFIRHQRGPYSKELGQEYFANKHAYEHHQSRYVLTDKDIQILDKLSRSVNLLSLPRLEGTASALFLIDGQEVWDERKLMVSLEAWKPNLSREELLLSIDDAKKVLLKDEYMTPSLKEELAVWEQAGVDSVFSLSQGSLN